MVITKGQNPEHRDSRTLRLYCTFRKQQKSVNVTELGNWEGLKDTLDLKQVEPQDTRQFLVICQSQVTAATRGNGLTLTVNRPACFNPCVNYTQAASAQQ